MDSRLMPTADIIIGTRIGTGMVRNYQELPGTVEDGT